MKILDLLENNNGKNSLPEHTVNQLYKLLDQEIIEQLTYFGRPCTQDCSGHKAGRSWELKHNKNTRANTPSNSFNNGTEIAINHKQAGTQNQISGGIRNNGKFAKFQPIPKSQYK